MLLLCLVGVGCSEQIVVDNQDAQLVEVGPVTADNQSAVSPRVPTIPYTLNDPEGDDQDIRVEICEAGGANCGYPIQAADSDGTTFVPTTPQGTDVPHLFRWDAACGRLSSNEKLWIATDLETSYEAKITVLRTTQVKTTEAFTLKDLGIDTLAPCSRADLAVQQDAQN